MKKSLLSGMILGVVIAFGGVFSGCETVSLRSDAHAGPGNGPPNHAPAHGHRKKHDDGHQLVFDSGLGVYFMADVPYIYVSGGKFLRYVEGHWLMSDALKGNWVAASSAKVPNSLHKNHPGKGKGKAKGKEKKKSKDNPGKGRGKKK
jgi:hypothetical protein